MLYSRFSFVSDFIACCCLVAKPCLTLCDPVDYISHQALLSMGFPRQEYWRGLPFPAPGDIPNPGIKTVPLVSLVLAGGFFTS